MTDHETNDKLDGAEAEAEQVAWEWFAGAHPHEAHEKWPDRFWDLFQSRCPGVTREQMERTLMETAESPNMEETNERPH